MQLCQNFGISGERFETPPQYATDYGARRLIIVFNNMVTSPDPHEPSQNPHSIILTSIFRFFSHSCLVFQVVPCLLIMPLKPTSLLHTLSSPLFLILPTFMLVQITCYVITYLFIMPFLHSLVTYCLPYVHAFA